MPQVKHQYNNKRARYVLFTLTYFTASAGYIRAQAQIYNNNAPLSIACGQNFLFFACKCSRASAI